MAELREGGPGAAGIEIVEPSRTDAGVDSLLYITGWCARGAEPELLLDGRPVEATIYPLAAADAEPNRFAAVVTVRAGYAVGSHRLSLRVAGEALPELAHVQLEVPPGGESIPFPAEPADEPLVAICMAAYEPPPGLLEQQVASIRRQTHRRFVCIVSDDASSEPAWERIRAAVGDDSRFVCVRGDERLGYYRNFERALRLVPREAELVAFADQDDRWYPDKVETLVAAIRRDGAQLVCGDMRIVDAEGRVMAPGYWTERRRNVALLTPLLLMNSLPGAAILFRRELLDTALPFPPEVGRPFHDHWLATVALARGRIECVERPLQDYVQHGGNVTGRHVASGDLRGGPLHALRRLAAEPRRRLASTRLHASTEYLAELVRIELFARTIELRVGGRLSTERSAEIRRLARLRRSGDALLWLAGRSVRDASGRGETLGAENQLLKALIWTHAETLRRRVYATRRRR